MEYPKQLITTLCNELDPALVEFFNIEQRKYFSAYDDINHMVDDTMWEFVKNSTAKQDLTSVYGRQVMNRNQKRIRWTDSFFKGLESYQITSHNHPLHSIEQAFKSMDAHSFIKLYEVETIDQAIEKYIQLFNDWNGDKTSLLIDCPVISTKTVNQVVSSFRIDLILNIIEIVMKLFDGNLDSFFLHKPELLIDHPIFSAEKFSVPIKVSLGTYVADLVNIDNDNIMFQMILKNPDGKSPEVIPVFDQKDSLILMSLINSITVDFYETASVTLEIGAIAKKIYSRPNKHIYDEIKNRLHNMGLITFRACKKDNPSDILYTFSFIDSVRTPKENGREYVVVTFGRTLYDSITKQKMISVTSSNYNSLEQPASHLLYHNLQRERILLFKGSAADSEGLLHKAYDYSFFQRAMLFKKKKKADIINYIKLILDEFVEKKIALAKYTYDADSDMFHLYYYTLSSDEQADLLNPKSTLNVQLQLPLDEMKP